VARVYKESLLIDSVIKFNSDPMNAPLLFLLPSLIETMSSFQMKVEKPACEQLPCEPASCPQGASPNSQQTPTVQLERGIVPAPRLLFLILTTFEFQI
jgi:hypothetical protein